ncbi:adhesion G protein-coupled receptor B2-like [Uloborus diversus]|uniref:adhesion G protein-coupled receptor B2-like n=1 Tax=Uloborus diversus TaxID=327109 RepID=UPI00240A06BB|nr:adhesion G protein-coupled receptor B2-like [Uloborus diversus]
MKKNTVLFPPGSQKNKLITEKAVDMVFDLTYLAERALRGLLNTQKKQISFRSSSNVVLYLYRGKLSRQFSSMNFSSEYDKDDELSSFFNLEKTLERSAYALIWIKGLNDLFSETKLLVNSDIAVATILSPLNSLNHLKYPPTFDIGLRLKKEVPDGYVLKCGQLWNMSHLWNTQDCLKANIKGSIVTCRCHHLGSIALLLEEIPQSTTTGLAPPVGNLIIMSCAISLCAIIFSLIVHIILQRKENRVSSFILISILLCMTAIQTIFIFGVNRVEHFETCLLLAILLHYCFLKSCFWVVSYSIYLLRRLRSGMEYAGRIRDYCAACWILPLLWLVVSSIANSRGYETKQFCWLNVQKGIVWSFVVPVTGLILVNTVVMILALKTFSEQMSVTHRNEIYKTRTSIRAGITLLPFLAINWFFGILAVEDSGNIALQTVFFFTNAMQGIMTLIFFCVMDNNVQMFFRMKLGDVSRKPKISAMKMRKSGSFPIMERSLISFTEDGRRLDCTPLLSSRSAYHETPEDPCCSNIRV